MVFFPTAFTEWRTPAPSLRNFHAIISKKRKDTSMKQLWILPLFLLLSCGGDGGKGSPDTQTQSGKFGSCDVRATQKICLESYGFYADNLKAACDQSGGIHSSTEKCPPTSRVGRCKMAASPGAPDYNTYHYYAPTFTTPGVQSTCSGVNGEFTPSFGQ